MFAENVTETGKNSHEYVPELPRFLHKTSTEIKPLSCGIHSSLLRFSDGYITKVPHQAQLLDGELCPFYCCLVKRANPK